MAQAQSRVETEESAQIVALNSEQTAHERFGDPKNFINRELSWLEFNRRVLEEAQDPTQPLIERVKFLCIFSSNLDEFFEIRVAGIKQQIESETSDVAADGLRGGSSSDADAIGRGRESSISRPPEQESQLARSSEDAAPRRTITRDRAGAAGSSAADFDAARQRRRRDL